MKVLFAIAATLMLFLGGCAPSTDSTASSPQAAPASTATPQSTLTPTPESPHGDVLEVDAEEDRG